MHVCQLKRIFKCFLFLKKSLLVHCTSNVVYFQTNYLYKVSEMFLEMVSEGACFIRNKMYIKNAILTLPYFCLIFHTFIFIPFKKREREKMKNLSLVWNSIQECIERQFFVPLNDKRVVAMFNFTKPWEKTLGRRFNQTGLKATVFCDFFHGSLAV